MKHLDPLFLALARERAYFAAGLLAVGDIIRRIADALLGRPAVAPVPVPVRADSRRG